MSRPWLRRRRVRCAVPSAAPSCCGRRPSSLSAASVAAPSISESGPAAATWCLLLSTILRRTKTPSGRQKNCAARLATEKTVATDPANTDPNEPEVREAEDDELRYRPPEGTRTYDAWLIATFFGIGFTPKAPGTAGSLATVLLWALAARFIPADYQFMVALLVACAAIIAGIPCASIVCRESGLKDPQIVVIDEVAGQMITLLLVPLG